MLHAHAPGTRGSLVFIGFTPHDLAHLARLQPINIDGKDIGAPGSAIVMMREGDPMIEMYLQFPIAVIRLRDEFLATIQASAGFAEVPLRGAGFGDNTSAMFFFATDDAGVKARLEETGLLKPGAKVIDVDALRKAKAADPASSSAPAATDQRQPPWRLIALIAVIAIGIVIAVAVR